MGRSSASHPASGPTARLEEVTETRRFNSRLTPQMPVRFPADSDLRKQDRPLDVPLASAAGDIFPNLDGGLNARGELSLSGRLLLHELTAPNRRHPPQPRLRPLKTSPFLHGYELRSRPTPKPQPAEGRTNAQGCPACTRAEEPRRSWQLVRSNPDQSQIPPRQKLRGVLAGGQRVQRQSRWHRGNKGGPP